MTEGKSAGGPRPILVVEDDPDIGELLAMVLPSFGYEVLCARNGAEALELLRRVEPPCLILLDLMMPGMNGWDFRAVQRRDPELSKIPVVVMTGARLTPEKKAELGASVYLKKPLELDVLIDTVNGAAT